MNLDFDEEDLKYLEKIKNNKNNFQQIPAFL